jgi:hypothetical protein
VLTLGAGAGPVGAISSYRDELSSFRRFSTVFQNTQKVKKSVFAKPTIGCLPAHASATSISLGPHPCLLQGEQAALQMFLARFAARAASFLRQGSLPTPGVQLAHAATINAARSHRRGFSSTTTPARAQRSRRVPVCVRGGGGARRGPAAPWPGGGAWPRARR